MTNIVLPDTVTPADAGREFWRGVLAAGGFTSIPRWTLDPVAGVGEHEATIPGHLVAALRRLADETAGVAPPRVFRCAPPRGRRPGRRARGDEHGRPAPPRDARPPTPADPLP